MKNYTGGSVFQVMIEYYNQGGPASLSFEYSVDNGQNWSVVPADWLYVGGRTVEISLNDFAADYLSEFEHVNEDIENYANLTLSGWLADCAQNYLDGTFSWFGLPAFKSNYTDGRTALEYIDHRLQERLGSAIRSASQKMLKR